MGWVNVRLELPEQLHRRLKYRALDERKTLAALLREIIAAAEKVSDETAAETAQQGGQPLPGNPEMTLAEEFSEMH